jgi:hypothetical protein
MESWEFERPQPLAPIDHLRSGRGERDTAPVGVVVMTVILMLLFTLACVPLIIAVGETVSDSESSLVERKKMRDERNGIAP